jgi:hypothetical protein
MLLLFAITVGCLRVCPPPQSLVSLGFDASSCSANHVVANFRMTSTGLEFQVRRAERDLHVCVVLQESH